jgi:hypothetical protein
MDIPMPTEADLDEALADALRTNVSFATWFLSRTKFPGAIDAVPWVRSDNPWSRVTLTIIHASTGESQAQRRDCETDVLAVYEVPNGKRLALHIENKLADGTFTPDQPALYRERKDQWKGRVKLGNYTDALTVIVAPKAFLDRNPDGVAEFDSQVTHEELAEHLEVFKYCLKHAA